MNRTQMIPALQLDLLNAVVTVDVPGVNSMMICWLKYYQGWQRSLSSYSCLCPNHGAIWSLDSNSLTGALFPDFCTAFDKQKGYIYLSGCCNSNCREAINHGMPPCEPLMSIWLKSSTAVGFFLCTMRMMFQRLSTNECFAILEQPHYPNLKLTYRALST